MSSFLRVFSIVAYLMIFLQGSMVLLPFAGMLAIGIFTAEPFMRILLISADIALIILMIIPFYKRTKWTTLIDAISFFILLFPLLKIFTSFSFDWFNYFLFLFPVICFIVFFPLSIYLGHRNYQRTRKRVVTE